MKWLIKINTWLMISWYRVSWNLHSFTSTLLSVATNPPGYVSLLSSTIHIIIIIYHHQSVLPKDRSFTASAGTKVAVLPKAGLPPQIQEPRLQFYQGWIGMVASHCFPHPTLFNIWTDLKRSEKSQGHQRGGEESGFRLHRNSPPGLNISSIRVFD